MALPAHRWLGLDRCRRLEEERRRRDALVEQPRDGRLGRLGGSVRAPGAMGAPGGPAVAGPGPGDTGPGGKRDMYVFDVGADNTLSNQQLFSDFMIDGIKCGPDGARCDVDGNVWVSSNGSPWRPCPGTAA